MMKKVIFGFLIFLAFMQVSAQTVQGDFIVGGGLSYHTQDQIVNNKEKSYSSFTIAPSVGVFLLDQFTFGIGFIRNIKKQEKSYNSDQIKITTTTFAPFLRYYIGNKDFKPFLHIMGGRSWRKLTDPSLTTSFPFVSDNNNKVITGNQWLMSGGLAYFVNKFVSFEGQIQYSGVKFQGENQVKTIGYTVGFQVFFGE